MNATKRMSKTPNTKAKIAGYWKVAKGSENEEFFPAMEKAAPMIGPKMKPSEKATPIIACKYGERNNPTIKIKCSSLVQYNAVGKYKGDYPKGLLIIKGQP